MRIARGSWAPAFAGEQGISMRAMRPSPDPTHSPPPHNPRPTDLYGILTPPPRFRPRTFTATAPSYRSDAALPRPSGHSSMYDLLWLAVLAGLFLLSLAFVRLCDAA